MRRRKKNDWCEDPRASRPLRRLISSQTSLFFSDDHLITDHLEVDQKLKDVQKNVDVSNHVAHGLRSVVVEYQHYEHKVHPQPQLERVMQSESFLAESFVLQVVPKERKPIDGVQENGLVFRPENPVQNII